MSEAVQSAFHADVKEAVDAQGRPTTYVFCHGRLVAGETQAVRAVVYPLIEHGDHVVIDCSELAFLDSMGLGALVALKVSSVHKGSGTLEFTNLSPRIKELLRITKLTDYLARPDTINYGE